MNWGELANEMAQAALIAFLFSAGVRVCKRLWWQEKRVRKLEALVFNDPQPRNPDRQE